MPDPQTRPTLEAEKETSSLKTDNFEYYNLDCLGHRGQTLRGGHQPAGAEDGGWTRGLGPHMQHQGQGGPGVRGLRPEAAL